MPCGPDAVKHRSCQTGTDNLYLPNRRHRKHNYGRFHMIISCPSCEATFKVDRSRLGPYGRKVKCAKCGNVWRVGRDGAPAPEPTAPEPPAPEPSMAGMSAREILARHEAEFAQDAAAAEQQPAAASEPSPERAEAVQAATGRPAAPGILFRKPPPEPEMPPVEAEPAAPDPEPAAPEAPVPEPAASEVPDSVPEPPVIQQAAAEIIPPPVDVEATEATEQPPESPEPAVPAEEEVAEEAGGEATQMEEEQVSDSAEPAVEPAAGEPDPEPAEAESRPTLDPKKRRKLKSAGRQGSMTRVLVLALMLALALLGVVVWQKGKMPGLDQPIVVPPPPPPAAEN